MPNELQDIALSALCAEIQRRGADHEALALFPTPVLFDSIRARGGITRATHHISTTEMRVFAQRRVSDAALSAAPSGPWGSESERSEAIAEAVREFREADAIVALATECSLDPESLDDAVRSAIDNMTDTYEEAEGAEQQTRDRSTGGLPGRGDGSGWRTVD